MASTLSMPDIRDHQHDVGLRQHHFQYAVRRRADHVEVLQRVEQRPKPAEHDRLVVDEYNADRGHEHIVLPARIQDLGSCSYPTRDSYLMASVRQSRPVGAQRLWKHHHLSRSF
jgi:hypothetical protein